MIHPTADVASKAIGTGTRIWQFSVVCADVEIGSDCNICSHCFIESGVVIGDRVTIKNGVHLWTGVTIEDDVFVGPAVTFANDKHPRSKSRPTEFEKTRIRKGASIGANAVILPGVEVGRGAMIGAGAVVTRDVPPNAIIMGNPGRVTGFMGSEPPATLASDLNAIRGVKLIRLEGHADSRGSLAVANIPAQVPFDVKRLFIVSNVPPNSIRGNHAHRTCHQFLICVNGSCTVTLDDGSSRVSVKLSSSTEGMHVAPLVWGTQHDYSPGAALLVLASEAYDHSEYIRSYDEFLSLIDQR